MSHTNRYFPGRVAALLAGLALSSLPTAPVIANTGCAADAMLVFDGSASMAEIGFDIQETTRIEDAREALRQSMPEVAAYRRVGLLVYGPGPEGSCDGINLRFPPADNAAEAVIASIDSLEPLGLTPLTEAVQSAAEVLNYRAKAGVVVLVTDGNETCGGRPCVLGQDLARTGADLTVHVIGFKVVSDFFSWDSPEAKTYTEGATVAKCLADRTGGMFVSTDTVDELAAALRETLGCPLIGRGPDPDAPWMLPG